ncbi:DUF447 domain-containing protein [Halomarina litorea]|uniref:DUF447 domain-containing protein n=1 Tax=Halomarina litorea TaxID=2961595 RepID=UPI0020C3DAF3|nr:DUF447 domain-containing protein [Halomarina sp. BCD28]
MTDGESNALAGWPVAFEGVVESVVTTLGPNGRWNVAALGLHAPDADGPATARTWGRTRTWRNFRDRGEGYVQFTRDPVDFVEAACSVREADDPVLPSADAWAHVTVDSVDSGEDGGTTWEEWALSPVESGIERRVVPVTNRAHGAVVEATVAASRLDVPRYDSEELRERIRFFGEVVERCGGARHRAAWERFEELVDWR